MFNYPFKQIFISINSYVKTSKIKKLVALLLERINSIYINFNEKIQFGIRAFRVTSTVTERIKLVCRGSTVLKQLWKFHFLYIYFSQYFLYMVTYPMVETLYLATKAGSVFCTWQPILWWKFCTWRPRQNLYMATYPMMEILYLVTKAEVFGHGNLSSYGGNFVLGDPGRIFFVHSNLSYDGNFVLGDPKPDFLCLVIQGSI